MTITAEPPTEPPTPARRGLVRRGLTRRAMGQLIRNDLRLLFREPSMLIAYTIMPVALIAVVDPAFQRWLVAAGRQNVAASVIEAPGIAAVFNIILLANFALFAYRDFSTGVWDRTRATYLRPRDIVIAKLGVAWLVHFAHLSLVLVFAAVFFRFPLASNAFWALVLTSCAVTSIVALGFMLFALVDSSSAFEASTLAGGLVLGVVGGSFAPLPILAEWTRPFRPISPVYWVQVGFECEMSRCAPSQPGGPEAVVALLVVAALATAVGWWRFDPADPKAKTR